MKRNANVYTYNKTKLQYNYSTVCGHYCLHYLMMRSRQNSIESIIKSLSFSYNDQYVHDLISYTFNLCFSSQNLCTDIQSCKALLNKS